jgi:hypothetical protein
MDHPVGSVANRRQQADRRAQPTTFWNALSFGGRRQAFRRVGEGKRAYVDRPSPRAHALLFTVVGASVLDAFFTLLFIQNGGHEANPFMAVLINSGMASFVGVKMMLTGLGAWFLAAHEYFPVAFKGLHALAVGYVGILLIHAAILLS